MARIVGSNPPTETYDHFLFVVCCADSGPCEGLMTRSEESYCVCVCVCVCVIVKDPEISTTGQHYPDVGVLRHIKKEKKYVSSELREIWKKAALA